MAGGAPLGAHTPSQAVKRFEAGQRFAYRRNVPAALPPVFSPVTAKPRNRPSLMKPIAVIDSVIR